MSVSLESLSKTFHESKSGAEIPAIRNIDYELESNRFYSVIGPSGCGKTTLLRLIAGLETASEGRVLLDGEEITRPSRKVGLVFQEYALFSWRSVLENIEFGLEVQRITKHRRREMALKYIARFGLSGFEEKFPKELSGGMQQRVAIARTMIVKPRVLLMDEPFGALDSQTRNSLQEFLVDVWGKSRETIVFVTHNIDEAVFLSDKIIMMSRRPGQIRKVLDINLDLPRPRERSDGAFNAFRREITGMLKEEAAIAVDRNS